MGKPFDLLKSFGLSANVLLADNTMIQLFYILIGYKFKLISPLCLFPKNDGEPIDPFVILDSVFPPWFF